MVLMALLCLAFAAYPFFDMARGDDESALFAAIWAVLFVGIALLVLRSAEPFELRLYPETRTYRLTQGFPGVKRASRGTYDDINCLYLDSSVTKGASAEWVAVRWRNWHMIDDFALKTGIKEHQDALAEMERLSAELGIPACPKGRRPADG